MSDSIPSLPPSSNGTLEACRVGYFFYIFSIPKEKAPNSISSFSLICQLSLQIKLFCGRSWINNTSHEISYFPTTPQCTSQKYKIHAGILFTKHNSRHIQMHPNCDISCSFPILIFLYFHYLLFYSKNRIKINTELKLQFAKHVSSPGSIPSVFGEPCGARIVTL